MLSRLLNNGPLKNYMAIRCISPKFKQIIGSARELLGHHVIQIEFDEEDALKATGS